jgi:hypothetical protein
MPVSRAELHQRLRAKIDDKAGERAKKLVPSSAALKVVSAGHFVSICGVIAALRNHTQFPEFFDGCVKPTVDQVSHAAAESVVRLGTDPAAEQVEAIVAAVPRGRPPYDQPVPRSLVEAATKMLQAHTKIPPTLPAQPNNLLWCRRWLDFALDDAGVTAPLLVQMRTAHQRLSYNDS